MMNFDLFKRNAIGLYTKQSVSLGVNLIDVSHRHPAMDLYPYDFSIVENNVMKLSSNPSSV